MEVADKRLHTDGAKAQLGCAWRHIRYLLWLWEEVEVTKLHSMGLAPSHEDGVASFVTDND